MTLRRSAWVPLFYALAVVWIYRDLWHQHGAATGLGWDTIDSYGPDLDFFSHELRHGRFSLWNPYDKAGYPLWNDPQIDRYYPFNWPFAAFGAVFGTGFWLVQVKMLAHQVVAATCMHAFLRTRGLDVRASLVGGLAIIASTPMLVHKASIILFPLVWVPLAWIAIDAVIAKPTWRRGAALAAVMTLPVTAASPPGLWYALLLIIPYAVLRFVRAPDKQRVLGCAALAAAILAPVMALAILPSRELVAVASRDRFATGRDFALSLSLPWGPAFRGVVARGSGLFEMYMGAAVVMLAACALAIRPRFDRGAALLFGAIAVAAMIFCAGATTPILPFLVDHVPGFGLMRVPGRYKLVSAFALAAAAGYGVSALAAAWEDPKLRVRAYACLGGCAVIAASLVAVWANPATSRDRAAWWSIAAMVVPCALAVVAVRAPARFSDAALRVLALVVLLDAPAFLFVLPDAPPAAEPRQLHTRDDELVGKLPGVRDTWRVYDEFALGERPGARLEIRDFRGYPAIDPLSQHRYTDVLDFAKKVDSAIVSDFNVRWAFVRMHFRDPGAMFLRMPNAAFEPRGDSLWEARHPAPLVAWYGAAALVKDARDVLPAVRLAQEPDGVRRHAVLEPDAAALLPADAADALFAAPGDERDGQLESYEPDEIAFAIDAPRPGLVVLNELAFPGWYVTVDGEPATSLRANYLLRTVYVPAGHHEITWRFDPAHWRLFIAGYLLALAVMAAAAGWPRGRALPLPRWLRRRAS